MSLYKKVSEATRQDSGHGHWSYPLLDEANGCVNECATGVSYYANTEMTPPAYHPFQEGFWIISGHGEAEVGGERFAVEPEMSFVVPANTAHALCSASAEEPLVLFWFHAKA